MITYKGGNHPISLNYCFHFLFGFLEKLKLDVSLKKKRNMSISISILFEEKGKIYSYFFLFFPLQALLQKITCLAVEKKKRNKDLFGYNFVFFFLEN